MLRKIKLADGFPIDIDSNNYLLCWRHAANTSRDFRCTSKCIAFCIHEERQPTGVLPLRKILSCSATPCDHYGWRPYFGELVKGK